MNNVILTILMIALSNGFVFAQTEPLDTDGDGYRNISTLDELRWVSENDSSWSWDFELDNNINAADTKNWNNSAGWLPIGNKKKFFQGIFEGNGFEIDSIYINRPSQSKVGFFGYISRAEIRNFGVVNCNITGNEQVGGLVGRNSSSTVINSNSTGSIDGTGNSVGGLVGYIQSYSSIIICYSSCNVSGVNYVGGLVGYNITSTVSNSYSTGSVSGTEQVGGFVGCNSNSTVSNSYSTGSVSGTEQVGGLVGSNLSSTVSNSYSTGSVTGTEQPGGLVGYNKESTVAGSFWDIQTSGQTTSLGGTGKTTEEMKTKSTFTNAGWNFDFIWDISTAYPEIDIDTTYRPSDTDADGLLNISTLTDLRWLSESGFDLDSNFELDNDINASDTKNWNGALGFSPIGSDYITKFSGEFEGHGFEIDSLYINRPSQSKVGFFGYINRTEIRSVGVVNCNIKGKEDVGGLVGDNNGSTVINCYSTGRVEGDYNVGGLVGANDASTVIRCYSTSRVEGDYNIGGLVGYNEISKVSTSYSTGYVTGSDEVGGLAGENNYSTVINCYSISSVYGTKQVGGFVGNCNYSTVINCYSTGYVSGIEYIGGLVGYNFESNVTRSFWDTQTSEQTTSYGGIGKTTQEMKTKSTFTNAGWNFDFIWDISTAFPIIDIDTTYRPSDTDADGYLNISTLTDLLWLSESGFDLDSDWEMDNDINAADTKNWNGTLGFSPIGINSLISFSGEFEGHGYKIDSLYINRPNHSNVGFFGYINRAEISNFGVVNCDITGENVVGGLVGYSFISKVSNSYSTGSVSGGNYIGGLAGANTKSSSIIESYSICSVSGSNQVGGLVGGNTKSTVSNSYSRGSVSGTEQVGGLVGYNYISKVSNSYSTGSVEGTGFWVGGIVGVNSFSETGHYEVVYSFWNTQTSGQTTSDGGTGKSTAEMKTKSTFTDVGWDFENIWKIDGTTNDGYPYFRDTPTGILEYETTVEKDILVYPNPAGDYIEITINKPSEGLEPSEGSEIAIYDVLGEFIMTESIHPMTWSHRMNVANLPSGVYFIRIGDRVEKFVKM